VHAGMYAFFLILDTLPAGLPFELPDQVLTATALRGRMRRIHYLTCALLALTWTAPLVAQQPTGSIRGRITDNTTQQPIAGVTIAVGSRSTQTREDGRFTISGVPAAASAAGQNDRYAQINQPVMVAGGDTVVVDLALVARRSDFRKWS